MAAIEKTLLRGCFGLAALAVLAFAAAPGAAADSGQVPGMDVSSHQGNVDWPAAWTAGARFAYIKATQGTDYRNPYFAQQYNGSYQVGMIRGAYHFATPDTSGGIAQADYFVAHGGGWTADGKTLPPMLDIEYNPDGPTCYGLSPAAMTGWIRSFSEEVHAKTSRWPMLYTTTDWWKTCTGNSAEFGDTHPLFIARYADNPGTLPDGWRYYSMWQYSDSGNKPGDQDTFNGSMEQLVRFAGGDGARSAPTTTPSPTPSSTTTPKSTTTTPTTPTTPKPTTTTTARADLATPSSTTTTTTPPSSTEAQPVQINGLVWAGPRNTDPPPPSLRANDNSDELVAQVYPAAQHQSTSDTLIPSTAPSQEAVHPLAHTGVQTGRIVVFGAALLVLGAILTYLARIIVRR
ncbi:lysozyme [Amycolatopsis sp.]|uniref:lysozyme n=1 Tax=Amycolatopsis sp. TaxID=37632 RepID=UPI002BF6EF59|nr:lysozyme [Amycolatopsis sp.]HVV12449.1 lysozyme [Amycolatopsis sp.]